MAFRRTAARWIATNATSRIPSFGFSGAGFLTCYHLGASKCLLEHGHLNFDNDAAGQQQDPQHGPTTTTNRRRRRPMLTGVSGGAIAAAAVAAGVDPDVGMQTTLDIARRSKGFLDVFRPGFSLLDQVEEPFLQDMIDAVGGDHELLLSRLSGGILRIGLTYRLIDPFIRNPIAYCYVDQYRDADDVVAACMLSSFIPGFTSTVAGSSGTVARSSKRLREMMELGFVKQKNGREETIIVNPPTENDFKKRERTGRSRGDDKYPWFVDGGLSDGFPVFDDKTVVVTPLCGIFDPNPSISPPLQQQQQKDETTSNPIVVGEGKKRNSTRKEFRISDRVTLYGDRQNLQTLRRMILSSDDAALQERFGQGYNDAQRFLEDNNLTTVHSKFVKLDPSKFS